MPRGKVVFVCQVCGYESSKWLGKCPSCGEWNTFVEEEIPEKKDTKNVLIIERISPSKISDIKSSELLRIRTGLKQFDDMMNGGLVRGQVTLLAGEPGVGKSTLMLQIAKSLSSFGKVLYVNSEESNEQIKLRAERLGIKEEEIFLFPEINLERITDLILSKDYNFLIVDSIQNIFSDKFLSSPGSVTQVREISSRITEIAKYKNITTFLVGHINKEGMIAGPKTIEHIVDTIIFVDKDNKGNYRILRAFKNRFGPTNGIAIYNLTSNGLEDVDTLSLVLSDSPSLVGSVLCPVVEGVRCMVVEVQSLVNFTQFGFAKRTADGVDVNRLYMIAAILDKYLNTNLSTYDIYLNVTTGFDVKETATDLAIAFSILSSIKNKHVPKDLAVFGELGLGGEVRSIFWPDIRINELKRIGVKKVILPKGNKIYESKDIEVIEVENIYDLISFL